MDRVIAYVDGYNLYHGLRDCGWKRAYWLNVQQAVKHLLQEDEVLVSTKYYTTIVSVPEAKRQRQQVFLEALRTLANFSIAYGHFIPEPVECQKCGHRYQTHHEKQTDVNIAVDLLSDAYSDEFDEAMLVSADSDLVGVVKTVHRLFPTKRITAVFPPRRQSTELKRECDRILHLDQSGLLKSMFADEVRKADGYVLRRPKEWERNVPPRPKRKIRH